ncbi:putative aminotransferase GliI-like protein [Annulohypoxylon bovei var. microspora]|nr:putative aminotransferase GliI-like protein [Annulohypoxylon bovei var. microspora]
MTALSKRGAQNVGTYVGHLPVSLIEVVDDSNWIDLSFAENYTIRKDVLEIFRDAVATQVNDKDLNWPHGFWGEARLLTALSSLFNTYFAPFKPVENKNIVLTAGAAGSLDGLAWSLCDPGEGILVPCPYHAGAYEVFLNIHTGIVPIPVGAGSLDDVFGEGMIPTLERGLRDATIPIKAVVVTNPHNPLGRCYSKEILIELMRFCQRHNLHLIADEVFALSEHGCSDLRQPRKFTSALAIDAAAHGCDASKIHVIWSLSKDLGATGARLGCVVTRSKDVRDSIALVAHTSVSNLSILFARALLTSPRLHTIIQLNSSRLATAFGRIKAFFEANSIEYLPCEVATFVLARLAPYSQTRSDEKAAVAFYQKSGILFFSAADYHMPPNYKGWMRVSFAVEPERLIIAIGRLKAAYQIYMACGLFT